MSVRAVAALPSEWSCAASASRCVIARWRVRNRTTRSIRRNAWVPIRCDNNTDTAHNVLLSHWIVSTLYYYVRTLPRWLTRILYYYVFNEQNKLINYVILKYHLSDIMCELKFIHNVLGFLLIEQEESSMYCYLFWKQSTFK